MTTDMADSPAAAPARTPPVWFTEALAAPAEDASVPVAAARISYRAWGRPGRPGVVLVHGTAAHARWWDHVAPLLTGFSSPDGGPRVAALSMSGHGDSDWRDRYTLGQWADEVMAVAAAAGITGPPVIIGHSLGGTVAATTARRYGSGLAGIVVIDSPVFEGPPPPEMREPRMGFGTTARTYPSREAITSRFRLVPEQPVLPYVREHVAGWSVTARENGEWGWKFDQSLFSKLVPQPEFSALWAGPVPCRVAVLHAQHGLMSAATADQVRSRLGSACLVVELPAAGHHVMLDQPLPLVAALRAVLAAWAAPETRGFAVLDGAREG